LGANRPVAAVESVGKGGEYEGLGALAMSLV
jgi:hypothetical protein